MDTFATFCQLIGFSIIVIALAFGLIFLFCWFFEAVLRRINNRIADRLITLYGLVKMQSLYANRDRLTFVWRKEPDVNSDDAD